jgi:excisionase family DNA binding protein
MSKATFKILKQCQNCGNMFEAQKISTRYCSHKCNSASYKLKAKLIKKGIAEAETFRAIKPKPKVKALNMAIIKEKEFLSVRDIASLFECTPKTIYNIIKQGTIKAVRISSRKTLIKRSTLDKLFTTN